MTVFKAVLNQDTVLLQSYSKLNKRLLTFVEEFLKKHLELMFLNFDFDVILAIVNKMLVPHISDSDFALRSSALLALDSFNEFVFNNLRKPSKKRPALAQKVQLFYNKCPIFEELLHALTYTLLFEDHKNVWIFQKPVHSTIAMCEGGAVTAQNSFRIMSSVVEAHEHDQVRK